MAFWIPAFAGMTFGAGMAVGVGMVIEGGVTMGVVFGDGYEVLERVW